MNEVFTLPNCTCTFNDDGIEIESISNAQIGKDIHIFLPYGCITYTSSSLGVFFLEYKLSDNNRRRISFEFSSLDKTNKKRFKELTKFTLQRIREEMMKEDKPSFCVDLQAPKDDGEFDEVLKKLEEDEEIKELLDDLFDNSINETRKRCNVCGYIFCYNQEDIKKNKSNATDALLSSISGLAGTLGGYATAGAVNHANAKNSLNRIVDFNRCPQCNSTNLSTISKEDLKKTKAQNQAQQSSAPAVSTADEIKKFKELLDMGAISQEEYDQKKKELLGL